MIEIGDWQINSVVNGTVRLDGGAMFGVVPKVLWEGLADVDDKSRILLATRTLMAFNRKASRVVLVDTGCGTKWEPDKAKRYAIEPDLEALPSALRSANLTEVDVTDVVITHLHFDHNGGLLQWKDEPGGETVPRYPNARHWIHHAHWEHAHKPHFKDRASFLPHDFVALADTDLLKFMSKESAGDGLSWFVSNGHTPFQLHPIFSDGKRALFFAGDIIPTVAHLRLGWVMAYDVAPMTTIEEKHTITSRCIKEGMWLAFPHDPKVGGVALDGTPERPVVARALEL